MLYENIATKPLTNRCWSHILDYKKSGCISISKVFEGSQNGPGLPFRRHITDARDRLYNLSELYNSTLLVVTIEQSELNIRADILPRESLRFYAKRGREYLFTFRYRGIELSRS